MPALAELELDALHDHPENSPLHLPSSFTLPERELYSLGSLTKVETDLRIGMAHDLLEEVRNRLGFKAILLRHIRAPGGLGIAGFTREQARVRHVTLAAEGYTLAYNTTFSALKGLGVPFGLKTVAGALQEIKHGDLRMLSEWLEVDRTAPGSHRMVGHLSRLELPWFWRVIGGIVNDDDDDDEIKRKMEEWNTMSMIFCSLPIYTKANQAIL